MERRDYRTDPEGKPLWLRASDRIYRSWYSFIEEGFEKYYRPASADGVLSNKTGALHRARQPVARRTL